MVPLLTDEDIPQGVVDELVQLATDVLTAKAAGLANQRLSDSAVLAFATSNGRALVTHNRRHYMRLHLRQQAHAGIIACTRDDSNPRALAQRIIDAIRNELTLVDRLIRIYRLAQP